MEKIVVGKLMLLSFCLFIVSACSYLPEPFEVEPIFTITENAQYIQIENGVNPEIGIIFYPGGFVDAHAYIPTLTSGDSLSLNQVGIVKSFIVKMPANLAVLDARAAVQVVKENPEIKRWYIAGHSLGGAMACTAVNKNPTLFDGLILMAAYPASNVNLSDWQGKVLSLRGSNDGLTAQQDIDNTKTQLPANTKFIDLQGGNHAGFAQYGKQKGDGINELSNPSQIDLTIQATLDLLQ